MFSRLGLQKRIMLYATLGLVLMFGTFLYLGDQAVQRSIEQVFEERLGIAEGVAAALALDFAHVIRDVPKHVALAAPDSDEKHLKEAAQEAFDHLARVDVFVFFKLTSLWLLDTEGRVLASVPGESFRGSQVILPALLANGAEAGSSPHVLPPQVGQPSSFVSISVPLQDTAGNIWAWVLVNTEGFSSAKPFEPFRLAGLAPNDWQTPAASVSARAGYHLEVLAPSGIVVLGVGPDEKVGQLSPHVPLIKSVLESRETRAMLHETASAEQERNHVMAAAPVPLSDLYVVLEQNQDVALAVPAQLRQDLLSFSALGLLVALVVAWVTTRHVVKPTEQLTAAVARMAKGELSNSIQIRAEDEIGVLAENVETMRQQLQDALQRVESDRHELESRVQERTSQLRELVRRVLTAQEEERRRIALELHDETAQALTALSVTLDSVLRGRKTHGEDALLREARQIAEDMMEGLRRLINALRPVALQEMRLVAALSSYAEDHLERSGVDVHVSVEGVESKVPDEVELALYRIGQEALSNVVRHAKARNVWIVLAYDRSFVRLKVQDDGIGFAPESATKAASRERGLGLAGMEERAGLVEGRLTIESAPGRGTIVQVEVPILTNG